MVSNRVRQGGSFKTRARTVFRDIGRNPSIADAPSLVACYFSCHLHLLSVARYLCPCYLPSSPADCFSYPSLAVACLLTCCLLSALVVRGRFLSCVFDRKTKRSDKTCRKRGVLRCSWSVVRMKIGCLYVADSPFYFLSGERIIVRPTAGVCRCSTLRRHRGREPGAPFRGP